MPHKYNSTWSHTVKARGGRTDAHASVTNVVERILQVALNFRLHSMPHKYNSPCLHTGKARSGRADDAHASVTNVAERILQVCHSSTVCHALCQGQRYAFIITRMQ